MTTVIVVNIAVVSAAIISFILLLPLFRAYCLLQLLNQNFFILALTNDIPLFMLVCFMILTKLLTQALALKSALGNWKCAQPQSRTAL